MKTIRVIFKNGVFVPLENVEIPDGTEGITVYLDNQSKEIGKPPWWNQLKIEEKKKEALLEFSRKVAAKVPLNDIRVVTGLEGLEVFVLVTDEFESLKPVMEIALSVYERKGVYLPVQVISERRLSRWRELGNKIYKSIEKGVSIK